MTVEIVDPVLALSGDLAQLPLAELVQFFHLQGRDGVLAVLEEGRVPLAQVYYERRQVVHAVCRGIEGPEAVFAIFSQTTGLFEFWTGVSTPKRTIRDSVQNLILEGLRRLETFSHLGVLLPGDDVPLYVAPEPPHDDIQLTAKEWRVLQLVNGKRTIAQIIQASGREEADVRAVLTTLVTADLVVTERDDRYLDEVVVKVIRQEEAGVNRFAPPTLLSNLVVKNADGRRTLRQLMEQLGAEEKVLLDEVRLLVRVKWLKVVAAEAAWERWVAG